MALVFGALAVRLLGRNEYITVSTQAEQYLFYAAITGLALVLVYVIGSMDFRKQQTRQGTLAGVGVIVFLGILVAVNYLSTRRNTRWDLTANKQYSLSEQTVKLLQGLKSPVKVMVFDQEANFERFRPRLEGYDYNSKEEQIEYIDADRRPVQTRQYNVDTYGTVVLEYMGRNERVTSDSEQDLTNALIGDAVDDILRVVRRSVVSDNDLDRHARLRERTFNRPTDGFGGIVSGDDECNVRWLAHRVRVSGRPYC